MRGRSPGAVRVALLVLLLCNVAACRVDASDSRIVALVRQILAPASTAAEEPRPAAGDRAAESEAATASARSEIVVIEAADATTLDDPDAVPDSRAFYRFVDEGGRVSLVQGLHNVPAAYRAQAVNLSRESRPEINHYDAASVIRHMRPVATPSRASFNPNRVDVTLYGARWCSACRRAKQLLEQQGIDYTNRDIDEDPRAKEEVRDLLGKVRIPLLDINGTYITGYDRSAILRVIHGSQR